MPNLIRRINSRIKTDPRAIERWMNIRSCWDVAPENPGGSWRIQENPGGKESSTDDNLGGLVYTCDHRWRWRHLNPTIRES